MGLSTRGRRRIVADLLALVGAGIGAFIAFLLVS